MWGKFVKVLTTGQIRWQRGFLKSGDFDENGERKFTKVLAKLLMRCWKGPIRYRGDFDKNGEISPKMWRNFLWDGGDFDTKMANMAMWQKWRIWHNKQLPWVWWYFPLESVNFDENSKSGKKKIPKMQKLASVFQNNQTTLALLNLWGNILSNTTESNISENNWWNQCQFCICTMNITFYYYCVNFQSLLTYQK